MKATLLLLMIAVAGYAPAHAQIMKKLGDKVKREADKAADKVINGSGASGGAAKADTVVKSTEQPSKQENLGLYAAYDFVPGDSVLFFDDLQGEEVNEIPSKWMLDKGRAEVMEVEGDMMIATRQGTTIRPRMKLPSYLPKRFTVEFDIKYVNYVWQYGRAININFANASLDKNQDAGDFASKPLRIWANAEASFSQAEGKWPFDFRDEKVNVVLKDWKHIAISVNEKSVKVYINQYRILNAQIEFATPSSFTLNIDGDFEAPVLIKNFRILSGGKSPAKQVTTNNVYIARGIQFERASPVLLPESMGEINNLVKLMKDDPAIKFEVAGHTSAEQTSSADANQKLSEARANTVRSKMMEMGVDGSRLVAKGYGQIKPIGSNDTPEGRATNRRVEFVKIK
jgi:OOP family OmpA-OmpF porin